MFSEHNNFQRVFDRLFYLLWRDVFEFADKIQMLLDFKKIKKHIKLLAETHVLLNNLGLFAQGVAVNKCVS